MATVAAIKALPGARHNDAHAGTAAERERQAQAALRLWSMSVWHEDTQLIPFAPDLQRLIAQFRSLARDITADSATAPPSKVTGAAAQELALVLTAADAPLSSGLAQGPPSPVRVESTAPAGLASAWRLAALGAGARLNGAGRDTQKTSVATPTATSPTVAAWLSSAAGAAFGSGATGAAAPAAALLAVVAVCLLGTWLPRRLADDGLACKSALLNTRLERPG